MHVHRQDVRRLEVLSIALYSHNEAVFKENFKAILEMIDLIIFLLDIYQLRKP